MSGFPSNQELTIGSTEIISVVVRICEKLVAKAETSRFDYGFGLRKKIPTVSVRSEFEDDFDGDGSALCVPIARKDFTTFDKGKIPVQLCLENCLMICGVRPIQMVTYREDDMSCFRIRTYHVDQIWLLNGQSSPNGLQDADGF
jgi:hypothetical protein